MARQRKGLATPGAAAAAMLDAKEVARRLNVSLSTAYEAMVTVPHLKLGASIRITEEAFAELVIRATRQPIQARIQWQPPKAPNRPSPPSVCYSSVPLTPISPRRRRPAGDAPAVTQPRTKPRS